MNTKPVCFIGIDNILILNASATKEDKEELKELFLELNNKTEIVLTSDLGEIGALLIKPLFDIEIKETINTKDKERIREIINWLRDNLSVAKHVIFIFNDITHDELSWIDLRNSGLLDEYIKKGETDYFIIDDPSKGLINQDIKEFLKFL